MKKKGISLIVLVITIVVIIILAAAVILSLGKNNPINSAKEAKVKTTIDNLKSELVMSISKITADTLGQVAITDIDAPGKYEITELIPSIKGTEYENELVVVDGKIQVKTNSSLSLEIQIEINNALGQDISADVIKNNSQTYIGATVEYIGYDKAKVKQDITWRIFNVTDSGVIQLIANDYVNLEYKKETDYKNEYGQLIENILINGYSIKSLDNRDTLISYLKTQSNWSELAVNGKTIAVGAPTIEEFCSSYKLKYPEKYLECIKTTKDSTEHIVIGAKVDGYVLRINEGNVTDAWEYSKANVTKDEFYIKSDVNYGINTLNSYWMSSPSASYFNHVMRVSYDGYVNYGTYDNAKCGVRPLITLINAKILNIDGVLTVQ